MAFLATLKDFQVQKVNWYSNNVRIQCPRPSFIERAESATIHARVNDFLYEAAAYARRRQQLLRAGSTLLPPRIQCCRCNCLYSRASFEHPFKRDAYCTRIGGFSSIWRLFDNFLLFKCILYCLNFLLLNELNFTQIGFSIIQKFVKKCIKNLLSSI